MPRYLGLLAIFLVSCSSAPKPQSAAKSNGDVPTVAAVQVRRQPMERTLHLVAEFRPFREIDVIAKVSGYVSRINVDIGDRVSTGQVLATLEVPEMADDQTRAAAALERAIAEVARAREEVRRTESASRIAQLNFERLSSVAKQRPGLIAQQELDTANARALETTAQYAGAKSALTAAEQSVNVFRSEQSRVNTILNYTRVVAPFPGVITRRYAEVGAMVQAGISSQTNVLPIVRLAQDSVLRLDLPIPESAVPYVRTGFPVKILIPTLDRTIEAKIDRFSSQLQTSTRTMTAQIDVANPDFSIKPGMFAEVNFQFEAKSAALVAPLMALDGAGEARRALRVLPDGSLAAVTVNVGVESSEDVEILSGLNEGDLLVLAGRAQLRPGIKVNPKITQAHGAAK